MPLCCQQPYPFEQIIHFECYNCLPLSPSSFILYSTTPHSPVPPKELPSKYPSRLVVLSMLAAQMEACGDPLLFDMDNIDQAIFERVRLSPSNCILVQNRAGLRGKHFKETDAVLEDVFLYFAACYERAKRCLSLLPEMDEICRKCQKMCAAYAASHLRTVLPSTNAFTTGVRAQQYILKILIEIYEGNSLITINFLTALVEELSYEESKLFFKPSLEALVSHLPKANDFMKPASQSFIQMIAFFAQHAPLAEILTQCSVWSPRIDTGKEYETGTLLGRLLSLSCLPSSTVGMPEMFSSLEGRTEDSLITQMEMCRNELEKTVNAITAIVKALLRHGGKTRMSVLQWLIKCFRSNRSRGKVGKYAQAHHPHISGATSVCY